jgi:hypothetical protein
VRLLRERSTSKTEPQDTALLSVVPDLVEDSVLVEELATTIEAEALVGGADVSLVDEIAQAECLVSELDAEVHGGTPGPRALAQRRRQDRRRPRHGGPRPAATPPCASC